MMHAPKLPRLAIIGISGYGNTHYKMLLAMAEAGLGRIAAATVINQAQEQEKCRRLQELGAELFDNDRAMFAGHKDKIDLCFIPTGIPLHAEMTLRALAAGANVYVEKPLCATVQDGRAMIEAARASGKFVMVGYQHMYAPDLLEKKRRVIEQVGRVQCIKQMGISPRGAGVAYYQRNGWAGQIAHAGRWALDAPFHNAGAHGLNLMCFLAGEAPDRTAEIRSVRAELYRGAPIESCDLACLDVETVSGVRLLYYISHCTDTASIRSDMPNLVIRGEKGVLIRLGEMLYTAAADGSPGKEVMAGFDLGKPQDIIAVIQKRLRGENVFSYAPEQALAEVFCANGAFESSPIHDIPEEYKFKRELPPKGEVINVSGLARAMETAFEREKTFAEIGAPWAAAPGEPVSMANYSGFNGGQTGRSLAL